MSFELIQSIKYFSKFKLKKDYKIKVEHKNEKLRNPLKNVEIDLILRNAKINLGENRN